MIMASISKIKIGTEVRDIHAVQLTNERKITLSGSVTGTGYFDGSGDLTITTSTNHTHNYAGSSSAGGGAKKNESYQVGSITTTYGDQWHVINQWITNDRLKIQVLNDGTVQSSYPIEVDHAYKLVDPSTEKNKTTALLSKGSATQPVYFSEGVPVACTYSINATVPANAKFTDTVYTHPTSSGNKHIPSGGSSGQILRWSADGTAVWGNDNNSAHGHSAGVGLTGSGNAGTSGTYTYKVNLVNETAASNAASYTAGGTSKFYAVQLDKNNKLGVYVPWTDNNTTYTFTNKAATLAWGTKSTIATVGGVDITVTMPANPNTNTHYVTGITAGATGTTSNSATTNGNTFIKIKDDSTHRGQIKIVGSGATTVTSDASGVITIRSTDNNTVYSHPAGSGASKTSGFYKFSTDSTSHISGVTAVTKADITALGIPAQDTTYGSMSINEGTTGTATTNRVLTAANLKGIINAHAPTKTGGGASGTWGISITGNAATATKIYTTVTNPTTYTTYRIPFTSGNTNTNNSLLLNNGFEYHTSGGTTSQVGCGLLVLGNATASGTAGNKYGAIAMFGEHNQSTVLYPSNSNTSQSRIYLPSRSGTIALTSDNVASASKVNNSLTIKLNSGTTEGTNLFTFNGSAAKSINITPAAIGASASGHKHTVTYAKATGTNSVTATGTISAPIFTGTAHKHTFTGSSHNHTLTPTTATIKQVNSTGTMFKAEVSGEVLILTPGSAPTTTNVTVYTGLTIAKATQGGTIANTTATGTVSAPTFTGTAHSHTITLTNTTVTSST